MADRGLSAGAITALGASSVEFYHLVRIDLATPVYYTDAPYDITYGGNVYVSNGLLTKIPPMNESLKIRPSSMTLELSGANAAIHLLGHTSGYKNSDVYVYRHLPTVPETFLLYKGFIDTFENVENVASGTSKVSLTIANHWTDWANSSGRTLSDENQQVLYPGDLFFEFTGVTQNVLDFWGKEAFVTRADFIQWYNTTQAPTMHPSDRDWYRERLLSTYPPERYDWAESTVLTEKAPVIYGEAGVRGTPIFRDVTGTNGEYLWVVYVLAEGECDSLTDIVIDERPYATADPDTGVKLSDHMTVSFHAGTTTQTADAGLVSASADWTSSHRGRGICYCVIRYTHNEEIFGGSEPEPLFIVKGRKCTPIAGGTDVWTEDPATILYDYLQDTTYGKSLASTDLDDFAAGSTYCSALVTDNSGGSPTSIARFAFNGVLNITKDIKSNVEAILYSMNASLPWIAGKYKLVISRDDDSSVYSFDDTNIKNEFKVSDPSIKSRANVVYYTYLDGDLNYGEKAVVAQLSGALVTSEDNDKVLRKNVTNKYENNKYRATNRAETLLKELRGGNKLSLTSANADAIQIETGDVVDVTRPLQNYSAALFRVSSMSMLPNGDCNFDLVEYDATDHNWNIPAELSTSTQARLTNPRYVAPPTSIVLSSGSGEAILVGDFTNQPRLKISFTASVTTFVKYYEIEYKVETDTTWHALSQLGDLDNLIAYIDPVINGRTYYIRIRAVNAIGAKSTWLTSTSHTVSTVNVNGLDLESIGSPAFNNSSFFYYNAFETIDGIFSSGMTLDAALGRVVLIGDGVSTTNGSSMYKFLNYTSVPLSWDKDILMKTKVEFAGASNMAASNEITIGKGYIGSGASAYGVGFVSVWDSVNSEIDIYGRTDDGITITTTYIASVPDNSEVDLKIIHDVSGSDIDFIVDDGTTETTITISEDMTIGAGYKNHVMSVYLNPEGTIFPATTSIRLSEWWYVSHDG